LADLDTFYDGERQKLERWTGPEAVKQRFFEQLASRHQCEREPFVHRLAELHEQIK